MTDIVSRAKALIMEPAREWAVIAEETANTKELFLSYAAILSLIPAVCGLLVGLAFSSFIMGGFGFGWLLGSAVLQYIVSLAVVWISGKIVEFLAPHFGAEGNEIAAMKLSVYSPTPYWIASVFILIPVLGWLVALAGGIYSIYVLYLGVTPVAKVPADKSVLFTVALVVASVIAAYVINLILFRLLYVF